MEIIIRSHNAAVSPRTRARAEAAVQRVAERLRRIVDAVVRFEQDGPERRVDIVLHAARGRRLVASGRAARFGPALSAALARLEGQARADRRRPPRVNPLKTLPTA